MKPRPWSFSHFNNLQSCPHKFAEVTVYKRHSDDHSANEWGSWVHKQIEMHFKKNLPWHENMLPYVPHIDRALAWAGDGVRYFELKMGISRVMAPIDYFHADVWGRATGDLIVLNPELGEAHVIDWKAGKVKPNKLQVKLLALFVFYHFPRATTVHTSLEWLQHGTETRDMFSLVDVQDLWREMLPHLTALKNAYVTEVFPKKPSGLCGWCPVNTCEHWQDRGR